MLSRIIKVYLKHLGISPKLPLLFVSTNDLASMSFCPNKVYIQVNFTGGLSYASESLLEASRLTKEEEKERILVNECIMEMLKKERFKKWEINKDDIEIYLDEEIWSFSHLKNASDLLPEEISNIKIEEVLPSSIERQIRKGLFHSCFRINFGYKSFFISAVPDIVILSKGNIKGIIEIKSSRNMAQIFPSEYEQVDFYRLYTIKRGLPVVPDAFFATIKYHRGKIPNFEDKVVKFVEKNIKNVSLSSLEEFVQQNDGLIKESFSSISSIEVKLKERIEILESKNYPIITKCPYKSCPFKWFCELKGVD